MPILSFDPADYGYCWGDKGWFTCDAQAAERAAKADRDRWAKTLWDAGRAVECRTFPRPRWYPASGRPGSVGAVKRAPGGVVTRVYVLSYF